MYENSVPLNRHATVLRHRTKMQQKQLKKYYTLLRYYNHYYGWSKDWWKYYKESWKKDVKRTNSKNRRNFYREVCRNIKRDPEEYIFVDKKNFADRWYFT